VSRAVLALLTALAVGAAGCGGGDGGTPTLTVAAATSLMVAFGEYAGSFPDAQVRYSFAGSDELAAQIRTGVRPDVFAAANTKLPDELFAAGKVERPVIFAGNRLVIAVPRGSAIESLGDLAARGRKLVVGAPSVPVGSYTRELLRRLPEQVSRRILASVRSNEPNVGGVVAKLTQRAADAGFVYVTDVMATRGKLRAIELPRRLQPGVAYGAAVVKGSSHPREAQAFIEGLLRGEGLRSMRRAGFEPPPG
jgi:molybdate transport system substrate-binding protein